jgi:hypothetical protein
MTGQDRRQLEVAAFAAGSRGLGSEQSVNSTGVEIEGSANEIEVGIDGPGEIGPQLPESRPLTPG